MFPLKFQYRITLLILYFLFVSILFFLPGSAFPKENWLSKIWFDKWVHIGIFAILSAGACWVFNLKQKKKFIVLLLLLIGYGLLVEIIQGKFVPNRDYDLGDLLADTIGSIGGIFFWFQRYIKK
jgi:VanZ family protein